MKEKQTVSITHKRTIQGVTRTVPTKRKQTTLESLLLLTHILFAEGDIIDVKKSQFNIGIRIESHPAPGEEDEIIFLGQIAYMEPLVKLCAEFVATLVAQKRVVSDSVHKTLKTVSPDCHGVPEEFSKKFNPKKFFDLAIRFLLFKTLGRQFGIMNDAQIVECFEASKPFTLHGLTTMIKGSEGGTSIRKILRTHAST